MKIIDTESNDLTFLVNACQNRKHAALLVMLLARAQVSLQGHLLKEINDASAKLEKKWYTPTLSIVRRS